jgi:ubiquinone biosynthesis protein
MFVQSEVSEHSVIKRSHEIASVLRKYRIPVAELFPRFRTRWERQKTVTSGLNRRLRLAIQELGPVFIKFGQMMSTRPDLISPELATELKMLTNNVETVQWETIEPVIEEYCDPIDETFVSLNKTPLAAASLSQAYLGTLKDGTEVVLKVQRPGIKDLIEVDLHILRTIAKMSISSPELQLFNLPGVVDEFSSQIMSELDFTRDGRNADLLASNMRTIDGIRVPKIYWKYSGQRLLVMEYMKGVRIDDVEQIKKMNVDPRKIAQLGLHAYWKMIFDDGFFHGDPHPGNLLVTPKGELVILDFGLFGVVRPEKRDFLLKMLLGVVEKDVNMTVDALDSLGLVVEDSLLDGFKDEVYRALVLNESRTIEPSAELNDALVAVLRKYRLVVPSTVMLMIRSFGEVQDVCSKLYPEFVLVNEVRPLAEKTLENRIETEASPHQVGLGMLERFDSMKEFPNNVNMLVKHLSKGSFISRIPDDNLERLERIADRTSYWILLGLVVAAIVVGMSLVVLATERALVQEPVQIAVLVYALAVLIVVFSMVQLMRTRDKHAYR